MEAELRWVLTYRKRRRQTGKVASDRLLLLLGTLENNALRVFLVRWEENINIKDAAFSDQSFRISGWEQTHPEEA